MNAASETDVKEEIASCLGDILSAVSYSSKDRGVFREYTPCTPEVLFYEYDKATKERKVEEETAGAWYGWHEHPDPKLHCETCGESHNGIARRSYWTPLGPGGWQADSLSVFCPDISGDQLITGRRPKECYASVMCQSCILGKEYPEEVEDGFGERCSACGSSNLLWCDEDIFEDHFHYNTYRGHGLCGFCPSCSDRLSEQEKSEKLYDRRERLSIPHDQDYGAQMHPAELVASADAASTDAADQTDDDIELSDSDEEDPIYDAQYENEELPENNTEKAKKIKGAVREVGEKIFDIQDKLKEGDYLEIMNLLQKVTNEVNSL
jgi:hypothetical protein